jgi:EAL domain-containing protein (putative c-di-GMP-specific phosphodiesterase class I)
VLVDADQKPVACEALVRWNHPQRGLLLPGVFIPFAEESGLIVRLGRKILSLAWQQLLSWQDDPVLSQLPISVNISMKQFRDPGFASFVSTMVDFQPQLRSHIKFEITESLLALNLEDVINTMDKLVQLGMTFSLDDFGTGYSSLSYLRSLPLSQLKIDRSFVQEVVKHPKSKAIAQTILTLGSNLGMDVVAEGVETPEQHVAMVAMGCRIFQGYLFSRPLPAAEFETLVLAPCQDS